MQGTQRCLVVLLYRIAGSSNWPGPGQCQHLPWFAVNSILHQSTDDIIVHVPALAI